MALNLYHLLYINRVPTEHSLFRGTCATGGGDPTAERDSGIFCECQEDELKVCGWDLDVDACAVTGSPRRSKLKLQPNICLFSSSTEDEILNIYLYRTPVVVVQQFEGKS